METDVIVVYEKYVAYVMRLREELDAADGMRVPEAYRVRLLSFEDFSAVWEQWGTRKGIQEFFLHRFDEGYDRVAASTRQRLSRALAPAIPSGSGRVSDGGGRAVA